MTPYDCSLIALSPATQFLYSKYTSNTIETNKKRLVKASLFLFQDYRKIKKRQKS